MPRLIDIPTCASTTVANGLSRQILAEMNVLVPGVLVDYSDLNISIHPLQFPLLQQRAKDALARAIRSLGRVMVINSGYRTCAQQFLLRRWRGTHCVTRAAIPGKSNHESGLGLDVDDFNVWRPYLRNQGWTWLNHNDPVHFDFGGTAIGNVGILAFQTLWNRNFPNQRIDEDGVYGSATAEKLGISPSEGFNSGAVSRRILRLTIPLLQGGDVRIVQLKLRALGHIANDADVDGIFGETTDRAVKAFQEAEQLTVDGVVGNNTYEKLGIE
jgi:hypothetical protein